MDYRLVIGISALMERDSTTVLFGKYAPTYLADIDKLSDEAYAAWMDHLKGDGDPKTPRTMVRSGLHVALGLLAGAGPAAAALGCGRYFAWFATQCPENARTFFQGITKLLPVELTGPGGSALNVIVRLEGEGHPRDVEGALIDGQFVANPDARMPALAEPVS